MSADMQLEIIDLQCDSTWKQKFASVDLDAFYQYLLPGYLRLTTLAARVPSMFGTTYLCEQVLSVMNLSKTKHLTRSSNTHLNDILKCVTTQDLKPDIDALMKVKRCQVSGASTNR